MAQTGRTVPPGSPEEDRAASRFLLPTLTLGPPEGLRAVEQALARGLASVAEALSALDRCQTLLGDMRWLLESLADQRAAPSERLAAMRGFHSSRRRLRAVCEGIALLDGSAMHGLRVITGIDAGAIRVAGHDVRPVLAAIAEAPSPRLAAAMLDPEGPIAEAVRAVCLVQRRLAADQRRLRNRQCLNAALERAWGDGSVTPPMTLLQRLATLFRIRTAA
ncbi:hypothetical protein [Elioraea rosea]|uniref:hypothetical protein n=1 Tax=Elioraea rosea TaxID=2492390 RepID=UPI001184D6EB|nr:hypothetical protein [Elioraea rosea]